MRPLIIVGLMAWGLAQGEWCGFEGYYRFLRAEEPEIDLRQALLESSRHFIQEQRTTQASLACTPSRYVIPVVFHIIYSGPGDSISYQRVWNQMLRVFEDFRRVPETMGYASGGIDTEIEFSLATKDPNGNPTTGVVYWRYDQPPLNWTSPTFCRETQDFDMKQATGWDRNKYLNIWIVPRLCVVPSGQSSCDPNNCGNIAGYAYFPSSGATQYGVVIGAQFFWGSGSSRSIRTLVHELGHNLNLYHTFQSGCGSSCSTTGDRVCDTPPTAVSTGNFSVVRQNTCTNDLPDLPDNTRNYMDYVDDVNMAYFSVGQRTRAWNAITSSTSRLYPLAQVANRAATGTGPYGHVKAYFAAQPRVGCVGFPIRFYSYSMGMPHVYQWDFGGGTPDDPTASCPTVTYAQPGTYSVQLIVENLSSRRDTLLKTNYIQILDTVYALPYREGFEGTAFPPAHTYIDNPDGNRTWERFRSTNPPRGAYGLSQTSMRLLFFSYSRYNERDSWYSPPIDLSPYTDPDLEVRLRFSWAYACLAYENPSSTYPSYPLDYTDSLRVYISTDCGNTWTLLWEIGGRDLATHPNECISVSGSFSSSSNFIPTAAQWLTDSIALSAYKGLSPIRLRFEGVSGWGNNLFIDDIEVDTVRRITTGYVAGQPTWRAFVSDDALYLHTDAALPSIEVQLYDMQGRLLWREEHPGLSAGRHVYNLPAQLPNGIYALRLYTGNATQTLHYYTAD
ncbi:MAG: M43 family zinc metalloprotease [Bacteroidia bacterium]|nr:M43 family zinc metalloprotease [Bacteroidia bacterium]